MTRSGLVIWMLVVVAVVLFGWALVSAGELGGR